MKYSGQLMEQGTSFIIALVFIGILLGAGVIAMTALNQSLFNQYGTNVSAWTSGQAFAISAAGNGTLSLLNFSLQMGSVGTIAAIGLVILVIVSVMAVAYVFIARR